MSAHTPAPWNLEKAIGTDEQDCGWHIEPVVVDYVYRGMVAHCADAEHIDGITKAERDANARLIAAAPDLLDQCIKALAAWEGAGPAILLDDLRAAIAKATGSAT